MKNIQHSTIANSITITLQDFANYQHMDNDAVPVVYGWWWVAVRKDKRWTLDSELDHKAVKGGEFLISKYSYAVDFTRYVVTGFSLVCLQTLCVQCKWAR